MFALFAAKEARRGRAGLRRRWLPDPLPSRAGESCRSAPAPSRAACASMLVGMLPGMLGGGISPSTPIEAANEWDLERAREDEDEPGTPETL